MQKPRFVGAFFYIVADALYAFKSRELGGKIGLVTTYPNRSKVPPHKCVLGSHTGMPNRKKPFNSPTRNVVGYSFSFKIKSSDEGSRSLGLGHACTTAWTTVARGIAKNTPTSPQSPPKNNTAVIMATG